MRQIQFIFLSILSVRTYLAQPPSVKSSSPVAVVAGERIYDTDLAPLVQQQMRQIRNQEYEIKTQALENLVNQRLLEAEAKRRGIPPEKLFEQEVSARVTE